MTVRMPTWCSSCIHRNHQNPETCDAFPKGIPFDIRWQMADHREPVPGDNGIQYELNSAEQETADLMNPVLERAEETRKSQRVQPVVIEFFDPKDGFMVGRVTLSGDHIGPVDPSVQSIVDAFRNWGGNSPAAFERHYGTWSNGYLSSRTIRPSGPAADAPRPDPQPQAARNSAEERLAAPTQLRHAPTDGK